MKKALFHSIAFILVVFFATSLQLLAQTVESATPASVLEVMQRVAEWQLGNSSKQNPTNLAQGVGDAGFMALAGISGDVKYRDAMLAMGETNGWKPGPRRYDVDDECVGQTYAELYFLYHDPKMIAPLQARFDEIVAQPSIVTNLDFTQPKSMVGEQWSQCDCLFMAPPVWARLYYATGDEKYLDFAVTNWWKTTDYLYDSGEHLFFGDSTDFSKREANGKKVFWSRGNGCVVGGLVRLLQYLPMNHPDRPRFEQLFKGMSAKILTCQQPDGLWRASLLNPDSYPLKETSGTGLFTYALAWGVNVGLLSRAQFEPAVCKAWPALVNCVDADGKLTCVQPIDTDPKKFAPESTEMYGVGAFLLAGSEIYKMGVLGRCAKEPEAVLRVNVSNSSTFYRDSETVEQQLGNSNSVLPDQVSIMEDKTSRILDSQMVKGLQKTNAPGVLFQVDLAPGETKTFLIFGSRALAAVPPPIVKTMARYVPERFDDFAWESDRIAHRVYGQALIKAEGTISSGVDVWIKKDRRLIVDTMYATKHYHEDNGSFMDDYRVGKSRGCGGLGIWDGKKLHVSSNWEKWRLITTGPIRSEFELTYGTWDAGSLRMVSETKHCSIDAGSWMTKVSSTISSEDKTPLRIGVGLAERACPTNREEFIMNDLTEGWLTYWQPEDQPKGTMAVAILLPKDSVNEFTNDNPDMADSVKRANVQQPTHEGYPPIRNQLAITQVEPGKPLTYYFGSGWDRSGDFTNHIQWDNYVRCFAKRRDQPLQVTVGN